MRSIISLALVSAVCLAGCKRRRSSGESGRFADDAGRKFSFEDPVAKLAPLTPSAWEMMRQIGADAQAVGSQDRLGGLSPTEIAALKPNLVLLTSEWPQERDAELLKAKLKCFRFRFDSVGRCLR